MVSLDKAIIARLETHGEKFEILVDPELAYLFKTGSKKDILNLLVAEEIFIDARKGERPTAEAMKKAFGTTEFMKIAEVILRKGDVQLTTEQRKKMVEEKRRKIVAILARECVDPRTGAPHPPQRIEKALEESRVRIDPFKDAEAQLKEVVDALRLILPMKFEKVRIAVRVPAEYAPRAFGTLKEYSIQKEEWQSNGNLIVVVEMPAGLQGEFYDKINKITAGNVETKILK
ncbi:ribosome assembly factor SBDS [Candidatus Micrarchaeota archaeon]|nr:ribosome assembly factor SBDS [Candidatus Micrarchaeota archaeon]